jgi:hypothetical protein
MRTQSIKPFGTSFGPATGLWSTLFRATVQWQTLITATGLLGLFVVLFATIQFATPNLIDNDAYFHIKFAQVMRTQGLLPAFIWLPLTILKADAYFDHHFLYHVLLIPFTYGDLREGGKWAGVIIPAFTFSAAWLVLRGQKVPYAALWALGLFALSEGFLYRMSMTRAQSLSLLILLLSLHVILTRRFRWLLPLVFLYVWSYNAFPLILVLVAAYVAVRLLLEGHLDLAPVGYAVLGLGLGLIINPYFPDNLSFIYHHLAPKLTETTATKVGTEWYPYDTWVLVENSGLALLAFIAGAFALGLHERRMSTATATLLLLATLFGLMLFKSRRFIEYYPAFVWLFCALAWGPVFQKWLQSKPWMNMVLPLGLMLVLIPAMGFTVQAAQAEVQESKPYQRYAEAAAWLEAHTPAGSRVFQTDWDDFTRLYFYNTHNTYTLGLDPTYMQLYDAELYDLWVAITRGKVEAPGQVIDKTFGGKYVLSDLKHERFLEQAESDPHLEEVYRDQDAVVFQVTHPDETR